MRKTITREYDDEGRITRETVVEEDTTPTVIRAACTCYQPGIGVYCPVHGYVGGYWQPTVWTTSTPVLTVNTAPASNVVLFNRRDDDPPMHAAV